ncbi:NnrS family protein [Psychromonas sp. KJ10-10]|uniref:NnrS family protein n=1 Tax=Psychromonas sp. KJ10-10 TaxID=3391823 RepID=UPI0039B5C2D5
MINISNAKSNGPIKPEIAFLEFAFRPLFLLASLFSIISLLIWNSALTGSISLNLYGGSLWWHMHEMLFGFTATIIVGFLLTAVQNWTKVRSVNGKGLASISCYLADCTGIVFLSNRSPSLVDRQCGYCIFTCISIVFGLSDF